MTEREFRDDAKPQKAVLANFAIIGEAATRLPDDLITAYPDLEPRIREILDAAPGE